MGDVVAAIAQEVGFQSATRKKRTGRIAQAAEAAEARATERPGTGDRRRRSRRGRRGGRGATVLTTGQQLGIANVALKRLTGT